MFPALDNMKARHFDITAITPIACFVWLISEIIGASERREQVAIYVAAGILLAAPLLMLFVAHLIAAKSWKRRLYLLAGDGIFFVLAQVAAFIIAWFKPGWFGVAALSTCLVLCAAIFLLPICSRRQTSRNVV